MTERCLSFDLEWAADRSERLVCFQACELLPDGVLIADRDGIVFKANHLAATMLGVESVVGRPLGEVMALQDTEGHAWMACTRPYDGLAIRRQTHTDRGGWAGTFPYVAPEVLRGEPAAERADLYAFGMIAYELFLGGDPFAGMDGASLHQYLLAATLPRDDDGSLSSTSTRRCSTSTPSIHTSSARSAIAASCVNGSPPCCSTPTSSPWRDPTRTSAPSLALHWTWWRRRAAFDSERKTAD